jgi:hypothetical protein
MMRALRPGAEMPRFPLFLNRDRIDEACQQRVSVVNEVLVTRGINGEVSAGVFSWFGGKLSRKRDVGAKVELTPLLKALLLELEESENDRMVNLSSNEATGDAFLYFVGDGRIFPPWEVVCADPEIGLESETASTIQQERER